MHKTTNKIKLYFITTCMIFFIANLTIDLEDLARVMYSQPFHVFLILWHPYYPYNHFAKKLCDVIFM